MTLLTANDFIQDSFAPETTQAFVLIGVWIDTYVFYQSVLQKKTWIWSLCVAKT